MYGVVQNASLRAFGFPREYIQGPGALSELSLLMARHGFSKAIAIVDPAVIDHVRNACAGMPVDFLVFGGECTQDEAERLAAGMSDQDLVIGVGGGKGLDTAKMVSIIRKVGFFSVPTIASNDAPASRLVVLYDQNHRIVGTRHMAFNPDVVLVDTDLIARAPARFLRAGIGDALTKFFEARAVQESAGANFLSAAPPFMAGVLGAACLEIVLSEGPACLAAHGASVRPNGFERLVEAAILMSGLAFESGGLSVAHAMTRGLTRDLRIAGALHGEQVAYGVLVQLVLEGDAAMLERIRDFNLSIGLPTTLADFGIGHSEAQQIIETVAEGAMTAPYIRSFRFAIRHEDLVEAMTSLEDRSSVEMKTRATA